MSGGFVEAEVSGSFFSAYADRGANNNTSVATKWICEHIDNAIDGGADFITIIAAGNRYSCIDNGHGVSPGLKTPNFKAIFDLGNHYSGGKKRTVGQHGIGGISSSIGLSRGNPGATIRVVTKREGDRVPHVAIMPIGDICQGRSRFGWAKGSLSQNDHISITGTIIEIVSTPDPLEGRTAPDRIEYLECKALEICETLGEIYYKAIENGLTIRFRTSKTDHVVAPKPVTYKTGPEIEYQLLVPINSGTATGEVLCRFGEASDLSKERDLNRATCVRIVHAGSGRFINYNDLQPEHFFEGELPIGFCGEIILGDIVDNLDSHVTTQRWPLTSYKDAVCESVLKKIENFLSAQEDFLGFMQFMKDRTAKSEHAELKQAVSDLLTNVFNDPPAKKGLGLRYPDRQARVVPKPIKKKGTNSPWEPTDEGEAPGAASYGPEIHFDDSLTPNASLYSISPNDKKIIVNANSPLLPKEPAAIARDLALYYPAFRNGGVSCPLWDKEIVDQRRESALKSLLHLSNNSAFRAN